MFAGARAGAVRLTDSSGNALATTYLPGKGLGPQIVFGPGVETSVPGSQAGAWGVAVDGAGNVYLNNTNFGSVLQIPWTGSAYGSAVTIATNVANAFGKSVAVDGAGNVFVGSNEPGAIVTEIPRTPTGWGTQLIVPTTGVGGAFGITVDALGSLYVADSNGRVVKLPWIGNGYGTQITLPATGLISPYGVAVDAAGNVYIADHAANIVVELPWTGSGYGTQTTVPSAGLTSLTGLAVDGTGNLYVAGGTGTTSEIVRVPWSGSAYGTPTVLPGFDYTQVAVDGAGNVYGNEGLYANSELGIFKIDLADAPSLTFAATNVGSTSTDSPKTVTVSNIGNASFALVVPGSGTNPSYPTNFPVNSADASLCASGTPLAEGATCDVSVNFKPTTSGSLTGNVVLTDNQLNVSNATQSIAVSGTGNAAGAPQAVLSPNPLAFPGTLVGTAATALPMTLSNPVTAALTIASISVTGTNAGSFGQTNNCPASLAAGATCTITVTFTPASAATFSAAISAADNAAGSPQSAAISGIGSAGTYVVNSSTPSASIQPGAVAQYNLTIAPLGGSFNNLVALSAAGLPAGATVSFLPPAVTPGSAGAPSVMSIQTSTGLARLGFPESHRQNPVPLLALLAGVPLLGLAAGRRRLRRSSQRWILLGLAALAILPMLALGGCGGGYFGPTPQTYTVTVTGTSGSLQESTTVSLTVQ
jgi:hypothetical protein